MIIGLVQITLGLIIVASDTALYIPLLLVNFYASATKHLGIGMSVFRSVCLFRHKFQKSLETVSGGVAWSLIGCAVYVKGSAAPGGKMHVESIAVNG